MASIKINLEEIIPMLVKVYEQGMDFVDFEISTDKDNPYLKILVMQKYLSEDAKQDSVESIKITKIEDDDFLNKII